MTDTALCPLCQRPFKLRHRADGTDVFPTHGHTFHAAGGRKAPRCPVSGFSVQGLAVVQAVIDALASLRNAPPAPPAEEPVTVVAAEPFPGRPLPPPPVEPAPGLGCCTEPKPCSPGSPRCAACRARVAALLDGDPEAEQGKPGASELVAIPFSDPPIMVPLHSLTADERAAHDARSAPPEPPPARTARCAGVVVKLRADGSCPVCRAQHTPRLTKAGMLAELEEIGKAVALDANPQHYSAEDRGRAKDHVSELERVRRAYAALRATSTREEGLLVLRGLRLDGTRGNKLGLVVRAADGTLVEGGPWVVHEDRLRWRKDVERPAFSARAEAAVQAAVDALRVLDAAPHGTREERLARNVLRTAWTTALDAMNDVGRAEHGTPRWVHLDYVARGTAAGLIKQAA